MSFSCHQLRRRPYRKLQAVEVKETTNINIASALSQMKSPYQQVPESYASLSERAARASCRSYSDVPRIPTRTTCGSPLIKSSAVFSSDYAVKFIPRQQQHWRFMVSIAGNSGILNKLLINILGTFPSKTTFIEVSGAEHLSDIRE